jgi:hypothetical protein
MKKEYVILDNNGRYITATNETGSGLCISVLTKEEATREIETYYKNKNYYIDKISV